MLNKVKCPICGKKFDGIHECDPGTGFLFTYWYDKGRNLLQKVISPKCDPFRILEFTEIYL